MDGVIFQPRNFWLELHRVFGTLEKGIELTKKYLHTDYNRLVKEVVVKLWRGKDAGLYYDLIASIEYNPSVAEVFAKIKKEDWLVALISSGSMDLARRAQHDFGIDFIYANELVIKNGKVSGDFVGPLGAGTTEKVNIIKHLCEDLKINLNDVMYVGDSDTDIDAFKIVGKSIAFNCQSAELKKVAKHIVDGNDLRKILPLLA